MPLLKGAQVDFQSVVLWFFAGSQPVVTMLRSSYTVLKWFVDGFQTLLSIFKRNFHVPAC